MSINRTLVDTVALPTDLLPAIKAHVRVEHARDDALLTNYTAAAIGLVERKCNVSLNPAEYEVTGDELRPRGPICSASGVWRSRWLLPLNNAREFVLIDSGLVDISADYELWNPDPGGSGSSYLLGLGIGPAMPAGAFMTLKVGVAVETEPPTLPAPPFDLAPAFFLVIARLVGSMYENREASSDLMADGFDDELGALWRPDV